jgi:dTMP kinase
MFITFEGIDFCGKSTQVRLLKEYLEKQEKKVVLIREPGGTSISEKIRDILLDKKNSEMSIETEILLFSASRAQLVRQVIQPYIQKNYYVISDRFHDSTTAYQGFGRGIPPDSVKAINNFALGTTKPDITFFLDITIEEAEKRKSANSLIELDRIESTKAEFFREVRRGYIFLAKSEPRFKLIDGSLQVDTIHKLIVNEIEKLEKDYAQNE